MQWDFQKIEYFLKVAETLNFSQAAKALYLSPQSLNKQIIQLEKELGEPLFERTTRKVVLTDFGRQMKEVFMPVSKEFLKATTVMDMYLKRRKRRVRIGFFQALSKKEMIVPVANYLRACNPNIIVELVGGEMDDVIEWLYSGKCDLLITNIHPFEIWENAEIVTFAEEDAKIVVSQYHPWVVREKVTMEDMINMPLMLLERRKDLEKESFYTNVQAKERRYAPNFSSMVANIEMGDCYGVFPPLFESNNQVQLHYMDMPEECAFIYKTTAIYLKNHCMTELFEHLKLLAEEGINK